MSRIWNRDNTPLIMLVAGLVLALIAAGVVIWVINIAPVIDRMTGS
jgi:hypothetical protein